MNNNCVTIGDKQFIKYGSNMNIQLLSDLHFEFFNAETEHLGRVQIDPKADVVVLAGDIDRGGFALKRANEIAMQSGKPVVFVAGNHEFYQLEIKETLKLFRAGAYGVKVLLGVNYPNVKIEELYTDIDGVRFIGGTLWTDFNLYKNSVRMPTQKMAMDIVQQGLNDFKIIKFGSRTFTAEDSLKYHNDNVALINKVLELPFEGKKVLVTHHGLHQNSIHPKYQAGLHVLDSKKPLPGENSGWQINPGFSSHLPELLEKFDLALHGHTHSSLDYQVGKCRVVANPRGYPLNSYGQIRWENPDFEPQKIITI